LFFIELDTRWAHLAGMTANPNGAWVVQQARNLLLVLGERRRRVRFLLRDRDAKFCRGFDEVFRSEGARIVLTPVQAPTANAYAEPWTPWGPLGGVSRPVSSYPASEPAAGVAGDAPAAGRAGRCARVTAGGPGPAGRCCI
jgi:hypothetical protein